MLPLINHALATTPNSELGGLSPAELKFGTIDYRRFNLPQHLSPGHNYHDYVARLDRNLATIRSVTTDINSLYANSVKTLPLRIFRTSTRQVTSFFGIQRKTPTRSAPLSWPQNYSVPILSNISQGMMCGVLIATCRHRTSSTPIDSRRSSEQILMPQSLAFSTKKSSSLSPSFRIVNPSKKAEISNFWSAGLDTQLVTTHGSPFQRSAIPFSSTHTYAPLNTPNLFLKPTESENSTFDHLLRYSQYRSQIR